MVKLQYFNGTEWVSAGEFHNNAIAWMSLGSDNLDYRTLDEDGNVLKSNLRDKFKEVKS